MDESIAESSSEDAVSESDSSITASSENSTALSPNVESSSVASSLISSAASSITPTEAVSNGIDLITDLKFEHGFTVKGLGGDQGTTGTVGIFNYLNLPGRPFWTLAQWASKYDFMDQAVTTFSDLGNGVFNYTNPTKDFTIDTRNGMLTFGAVSSNCYDAPRTSGSEPWFHLLIESTFSVGGSNPNAKVSDLKSVRVDLSSRLTKFEDMMDGQDNPGLHAAQFLMYLAIQNQDVKSADYGQMIWFGFSIFDNRYEWLGPSSQYDKGTKSLIVGIGNRRLFDYNNNYFFRNGQIYANPDNRWASFSIDVADDISDAYDTARSQGYFQNTSFDQLYISGMNIGWEIPGIYDCEVQTKDLRIVVEKR